LHGIHVEVAALYGVSELFLNCC